MMRCATALVVVNAGLKAAESNHATTHIPLSIAVSSASIGRRFRRGRRRADRRRSPSAVGRPAAERLVHHDSSAMPYAQKPPQLGTNARLAVNRRGGLPPELIAVFGFDGRVADGVSDRISTSYRRARAGVEPSRDARRRALGICLTRSNGGAGVIGCARSCPRVGPAARFIDGSVSSSTRSATRRCSRPRRRPRRLRQAAGGGANPATTAVVAGAQSEALGRSGGRGARGRVRCIRRGRTPRSGFSVSPGTGEYLEAASTTSPT